MPTGPVSAAPDSCFADADIDSIILAAAGLLSDALCPRSPTLLKYEAALVLQFQADDSEQNVAVTSKAQSLRR
jgi:hypothetical protein